MFLVIHQKKYTNTYALSVFLWYTYTFSLSKIPLWLYHETKTAKNA